MAEVLLVNPRRRRRAKSSTRRRRNPLKKMRARVTRRRNPARAMGRRRRAAGYVVGARRIRRRRLNPIRLGGVASQIMPAVKGAVGAIATETAFRFLPTPGPLAILKGALSPVTKIGVAFGVAKLAEMFGGRTLGREMLSGALVVIAYDFVNQQVLSRLPVVGVPAGAAAYMDDGLGYMSSGAVMNEPAALGYDDGAGTPVSLNAYMEPSLGEYM